ncbi:NUDIX hydrolase [Micromonospora sp. NIE79]|uniref:NUDIX hydrolase n=1 Tax=Micromonospora trifolii TaxID=2911208 RepID=A0ABS9N995_9ACTN|nr:NUDIX hydrolase [Micromonospora trifolii]MCG5446529.1 NUDIX hydrolase [Micromonospora trifolii]
MPGADDGAVDLERLCQTTGVSAAATPAVADLLVLVFDIFDVVRLTVEPTTGQRLIKANAPAAGLFLSSLAEHVRAGQPILGNWDRAGTSEPPYHIQQVLAGPQFLYLMEQQRMEVDRSARPLRHTEVSQIVIKVGFPLLGRRYLMLYDGAARQYQLPGGHRRAGDQDPRAVAVRELEEELPGFVFDPRRDTLSELGAVEVEQLSRTFGVVTRYRITFFQLLSTRRVVPVGPDSRWVAEAALLGDAATVKGRTLNIAGLRRLVDGRPGGLTGLAEGIGVHRGPALAEIVREKPWEILGLIVGVLGLVLTLVLA